MRTPTPLAGPQPSAGGGTAPGRATQGTPTPLICLSLGWGGTDGHRNPSDKAAISQEGTEGPATCHSVHPLSISPLLQRQVLVSLKTQSPTRHRFWEGAQMGIPGQQQHGPCPPGPPKQP